MTARQEFVKQLKTQKVMSMYEIKAVLVNGKMTKKDAKKVGIVKMIDGRFAAVFYTTEYLAKWVAKNQNIFGGKYEAYLISEYQFAYSIPATSLQKAKAIRL